MATWKEIRDDVNDFASKASAKISDVADTASLRIKLTRTNAHLSEAYEALGRLVYSKEDNAERIEAITKEIDELNLTVKTIKDILETKKETK